MASAASIAKLRKRAVQAIEEGDGVLAGLLEYAVEELQKDSADSRMLDALLDQEGPFVITRMATLRRVRSRDEIRKVLEDGDG